MDRRKFINLLQETKEKFEYEIFSYCLMTNHIHLLIKDSGGEKLSHIFNSLAISYSGYYNKKYERTGHLFENRYKSKTVEDDGYILRLVRYIHQNPEKGGICSTESYRWSSYKEYLFKNTLVDTKYVFSVLNENFEQAKKEFIEYNKLEYSYKDYADYEIATKLSVEEAEEVIRKVLKIEDIQQIKIYNKEIRDELLRKSKEIKGISIKQLSRITGISTYIIDKAIN